MTEPIKTGYKIYFDWVNEPIGFNPISDYIDKEFRKILEICESVEKIVLEDGYYDEASFEPFFDMVNQLKKELQ